jgi:glycerate kinase
MRPIRAAWAILGSSDDGTAAIEMAAASGLVLLRRDERNPLIASTFGTGELIRAALDRSCTQIIVGVGGSATVDGGAGALQALGVRLLDASGAELPPGGGPLDALDRIDISTRDERLARATIRVASDVTNTLCGDAGAAAMFGPQKGASPEDVRTLEAALRHYAEIAQCDCGVDLLTLVGGGAAGGLAAGLALLGATIEPGFEIVAGAVGLEEAIASADLVITGEGRLDAQTAYGKTASRVALLARKQHKRIAIIAGSIEGDAQSHARDYDIVEALTTRSTSLDDAIREARQHVIDAAERVARRL